MCIFSDEKMGKKWGLPCTSMKRPLGCAEGGEALLAAKSDGVIGF